MGLILVDSSVWIDFLAGTPTLQTAALRRLPAAGHHPVIGDLVLMEVLQGTRHDGKFEQARTLLSSFPAISIANPASAVEAARHYRTLRARGVTVRKTIDTLIATRCILDRLPLLYSDRDFDPFVQHLGLRSTLDMPGVS